MNQITRRYTASGSKVNDLGERGFWTGVFTYPLCQGAECEEYQDGRCSFRVYCEAF